MLIKFILIGIILKTIIDCLNEQKSTKKNVPLVHKMWIPTFLFYTATYIFYNNTSLFNLQYNKHYISTYIKHFTSFLKRINK